MSAILSHAHAIIAQARDRADTSTAYVLGQLCGGIFILAVIVMLVWKFALSPRKRKRNDDESPPPADEVDDIAP
jgi:cbb3-type cytochrome oxidase subunit 3